MKSKFPKLHNMFRLTIGCVWALLALSSTPPTAYAQTCAIRTTPKGVKCAHPGAACNEGGGKGHCVNLSDGECQCSAQGPPPLEQGVFYPKYFIVALIYAPPGCTSTATVKCQSSPGLISLADYANGSSNGTKTSTQSSFKQGVSVSAGLSVAGFKLFGANSDFSTTTTDSSSETISKSQSVEIKVPGNGDGVDHSQDFFYILLNPAIAASVQGTTAQWNAGYKGASAEWYKLYVSWLQCPSGSQPSCMPANVAQQLKSLGFTNADYQTILSQDPFANGSTAIDPKRFARTTLTFPYEPPQQEGDCSNGVCTCAALSQTIKNELQTGISSQTQTQYSVGFAVGAPIPAIGLTLNESGTFTWTNSASIANTTDSSQSATVAVACPSANYTGPTLMAVYWDGLYGSFLFVPTTVGSGSAVLSQGLVLSASGAPLRHQAVDLSFGGKTYHTFTGNDGQFHFYRSDVLAKTGPRATAQLKVGDLTRTIKLGDPVSTHIRLK